MAASFSLATARRWKCEDGRVAESTEWHCIGAAAKAAENMVRKGSVVLVEGRLAPREYKDKEGIAQQERTGCL